MNARVFLLILVTGLFMAAWNGDQAAMSKAIARREPVAARPAADEDQPTVKSDQHPGAHLAGHTRTADQSAHNVAVIPAFRPAGMTAGRYRAVSEHGDSAEVRIDDAANATQLPIYSGDSPDGVRWYFIRIRDAG